MKFVFSYEITHLVPRRCLSSNLFATHACSKFHPQNMSPVLALLQRGARWRRETQLEAPRRPSLEFTEQNSSRSKRLPASLSKVESKKPVTHFEKVSPQKRDKCPIQKNSSICVATPSSRAEAHVLGDILGPDFLLRSTIWALEKGVIRQIPPSQVIQISTNSYSSRRCCLFSLRCGENDFSSVVPQPLMLI